MKIQIQRYNQDVNANANLMQGRDIKLPPKTKDMFGFISDTLGQIKTDYDKAAINQAKADFQIASQNKIVEIQEKYKGLNAKPDAVKGEYDKWLNEYRDGWNSTDSGRYLTSDQQKAMDDFVTNNSVAVNNTMNYHSMNELQKAKQLNYEAAVNSTLQAIASDDEIENINIHKKALFNLINNEKGAYGKKVVEEDYSNKISNSIFENISKKILSNPNIAINRYMNLKGDLSPEKDRQLQKNLLTSFIDTESEYQARAIAGGQKYIPEINKDFAKLFDDGKLSGADIIRRKLNEKAASLVSEIEKQNLENQQVYEGDFLTQYAETTNSGKTLSEKEKDYAKLLGTNMSMLTPEWAENIKNLSSDIATEGVLRHSSDNNIRLKQLLKDKDSDYIAKNLKSSIQNGDIKTMNDLLPYWDSLTGKDRSELLSEFGTKIKTDKILGNNKGVENNIKIYMQARLGSEKIEELPKYNQLKFLIIQEAQNMDGGLLKIDNLRVATNKVWDSVADESWIKPVSKNTEIEEDSNESIDYQINEIAALERQNTLSKLEQKFGKNLDNLDREELKKWFKDEGISSPLSFLLE